jgi:hypothetical protein
VSQTEYRGFSEANPDAVVVVGENGRIKFANRRVQAMLGYAPSELLGKSPNILVPDPYRRSHPDHIANFMADPTPRMMGGGLTLPKTVDDHRSAAHSLRRPVMGALRERRDRPATPLPGHDRRPPIGGRLASFVRVPCQRTDRHASSLQSLYRQSPLTGAKPSTWPG